MIVRAAWAAVRLSLALLECSSVTLPSASICAIGAISCVIGLGWPPMAALMKLGDGGLIGRERLQAPTKDFVVAGVRGLRLSLQLLLNS